MYGGLNRPKNGLAIYVQIHAFTTVHFTKNKLPMGLEREMMQCYGLPLANHSIVPFMADFLY